jgi:serine phosphatase RsbU (regulator of sigma subunit)
MTTTVPPSPPRARPTAAGRERTLARLVDDIRSLLPVDAVAFVTVDREGGFMERAAGWFATPELRDALQPLGRVPLDRRRRGVVEAALERDRPLLLPRVEAWEAAPDLLAAAMDALGEGRAHQAWSSYRTASVIAWQLRTEIGRPLGVLVVASLDQERPLGTGDLRNVEVVADLAAMALERASLLEAEAGRARDELRLKRAAEAVSASLELDEVYRRVVEHAAFVTDATKALLTRLDSRASELRVVASVDFSAGLAKQRLSLDAGAPGQVARTRSALLQRRRDADGVDRRMMQGEGIGSFMHAPIELGPRLYGVLSVAHEDSDRFGHDDLELLVKLARSSAAAIANAIDFERERRIARALTLGFVPDSIPEVSGYETGLLYAPSENEPTGGDIYGVWRLLGGDVAMLVGDVAGKGVETAALSAMVRFFVEARSWDASSPAIVLSQANSMLMDRLPRDTFVTAFVGVLSPDSLRYCNAGHLPPLLVTAGDAQPLGSHDLPLGIDDSPSYRETQLRLRSGDLLFAYTDGLVEARRAGEVYGHDRLARLVASLSSSLGPRELAHAVHEEVASWADGLSDDAVALALRRRP